MGDDLQINYNKTSSEKVNIVTCFYIVRAGVNTLPRAALALLIKGTILQPVALGLTAHQGVSLQPIRAGADDIVITPHITHSPCTTRVISTR